MQCSPSDLVPQGPGVDPAYQGCVLTGAQLGRTNVTGDSYFSTSFGYSRSHLWRNLGLVIAFTVLYILVTALASEIFSFAPESGGALIFKKTKKAKKIVNEDAKPKDEEHGISPAEPTSSSSSDTARNEKEAIVEDAVKSKSVFTWENVECEVPYQGGTRRLLNGVNGYAKPGIMIALMVSSTSTSSTASSI